MSQWARSHYAGTFMIILLHCMAGLHIPSAELEESLSYVAVPSSTTGDGGDLKPYTRSSAHTPPGCIVMMFTRVSEQRPSSGDFVDLLRPRRGVSGCSSRTATFEGLNPTVCHLPRSLSQTARFPVPARFEECVKIPGHTLTPWAS